MSFVSYAQNFEDVMLHRALKHVDQGFYIDVGAWSPDIDSVTRAFYELGWRGINVEPNSEFHVQLCAKRPRDINLKVAVGDHEAVLSMNFLGSSGLSTLDDHIAAKHLASGLAVERKDVQITTLRAIWREHVPQRQEVHFLKVDVEGAEKSVLDGNDWQQCRPWIVVVEATLPMEQTDSYAAWEPILVSAGYRFAYADGLNRYYVASEHVDLIPYFRFPPNVFDGFVMHAQREAEARTQLANLAYTMAVVQLDAIESSLSWRITAPLRGLGTHVYRLIERLKIGLLASKRAILQMVLAPLIWAMRRVLQSPRLAATLSKWLLRVPSLHRRLVGIALQAGLTDSGAVARPARADSAVTDHELTGWARSVHARMRPHFPNAPAKVKEHP